MYKYQMTENTAYKHVQGDLRASIENKKYIFLSNIFTKEEFLKLFYNRAHFNCIGGLPRPETLPYGSNITDNMPHECSIHGHLDRKDIRVEITFDEEIINILPPPEFSNKLEIRDGKIYC